LYFFARYFDRKRVFFSADHVLIIKDHISIILVYFIDDNL
jgi:hypothetical protein